MATKQRARSDTDKQQRREHILTIALELYAQCTFAQFAMSEVAIRSGLAKGTLYLYFQTKEELFLALLEQELVGWFDDLDAGLQDVVPEVTQVTELICATLERRHALTRLLPIAASVLEHNITADVAHAYKTMLLNRSTTSAALLEQRLVFLEPGDGLWLLLQIYALVAGLGQMADPAPVVRAILEEPDMSALRVTFSSAFHQSLRTMLRGLEHRSHW